jgi:DNA-binding NarL/FixJ family response regulator
MRDVLRGTGESALVSLANLSVTELQRIGPDVLVCDVDSVAVDRLEFLRQLRFVLPECVITVYTGNVLQSWSRACHLAGVNCLLAKGSDAATLATGLREALSTGCYTDAAFSA